MNISAEQMETIVRVVVERLRGDAPPPARNAADSGVPKPSAPMIVASSASTATSDPNAVHLSGRVITLESLKGRLTGAQSVVVHPKAIITPAVVDELRKQNIRLVRQLPTAPTLTSKSAPLLLVCSNEHVGQYGKRVCPKQAKTFVETDAATTIQAVRRHLADGGVGAVWCSPRPFACAAATFGDAEVRAVELRELREFSQAIELAQPNVLIVNCRSWTAPAVNNLIRQWHGSLR
jgi:hypothetical protein